MIANLLSVVVPTRNRGDISECIRRLTEIRYRPVEIVVVDQSEGDTTHRSLRPFLETDADPSPRIRYLPCDRTGLSTGRNIGLSETEGDWVGFIDDDCLVAPDWGEAVVEAFSQDERIGMVFGRTKPYHPPESGKRTRISIKDWSDPRTFQSRFSLVNGSAGGGGNSAISRKCYESVGGFDENLGTGTDLPGGEDLDLKLRVLRAGYRIVYTPAAVCFHKRRLEESEYLRNEEGYYTGRAAVWVKRLRRADPLGFVGLPLELARRIVEVPYHFGVTRRREEGIRAVRRLRGFVEGTKRAWSKNWSDD